MRETQIRFLPWILHPGSVRERVYSVFSASGRAPPCLAVLTALALPIQVNDLPWRPDTRGAGTDKGCCPLLAESVEATDSTLESWLGVHEKPPPSLPPANTAATHTMDPQRRDLQKNEPQKKLVQQGGEADTDWRLVPFVAARASGGVAGQPTLLSIAVTSPFGQTNPQHEAITYVLISNLPPKATLSQGRVVGDGTWQVALEELTSLTLSMPPDMTGPVTLLITAVTDHGGGVVARQGTELTIPLARDVAVQADAVAVASPEAGNTPPPAQGGSSQSGEAAVSSAETTSDTTSPVSGSSAPLSPPEPPESDASAAPPEPAAAADAVTAPAPEPAVLVTAPAPAPEPAAPPADAPAVVQAVVAVPLPEPPPVATAAVAAIPAVTAPPPAPEPPQRRQEAVQRPAKPPSTIPEATLMKRGDDLFAQGDLAGARLYYEMAAEAGNARAAFALGRTHDPLVHERLHVRGLSPDPEQAAAWYRRAIAAGSGDAEQQLQKLTVWLAGKSR
ncbi:hypothetical protein [Azospirillum sp. TSO35-2]|uniref:hypothetical protein n=1 Tax=Azospirillum sp. TSO35-2 TaxID=716796 RepID=UPI0011B4E91B|nr:hypothetical protein [Azospirillum sp. TSO35-2]